MSYNFKSIKVLPPANDLINIVLSKTQRKTPTVVHPGYAISRIRSFYMRKIKFCQETISEKLGDALEHFPKIQDIHPFYADLFNVLYDKDHYKLALGHIKATKNMVENMSKDYLKLVKYADSLYRCKSLKRAAMGRMCTMLRKIASSLAYLEEVRKHLGRLPSINPYERTLMLTGYPNVGKSSFINAVSKANVEVEPYPFTTKALYIGHTDYQNTRFQVIDSPGVLDHQLEDMNTIEMQSVTALAHLKSCVLYLIDPSEQCGYSVQEQVKLYSTLKPLFKNKSVLVVFTKTDVTRVQDLSPAKKSIIESFLEENKLPFTEICSMTGEGITKCKEIACSEVMKIKMPAAESKLIKTQENYLQGLYVAKPQKRDNVERPAMTVDLSKKTKKCDILKLEQENGGAGVFDIPLQEHYIIPEEWKYDKVPQIYNGKNVGDFVDADIWEKLAEIEKEEDLLFEMDGMKIEEDGPLVPEHIQNAYEEIKRKKHAFREQHSLKKNKTAYQKNKSMEKFKEVLEKNGVDPSLVEERMRNRSRSKSLMQIKARKDRGDMQDEGSEQKVRDRLRDASRSRSKGYQRPVTQEEVYGKKQTDQLSKKWRLQDKRSQSDRFVGTKRPRHLFSGKTSNGKRDRR